MSRPLATMEKSGDGWALIVRYKLKARAAASKAGPRLADVAGKTSSCELGRVILGDFAIRSSASLSRRRRESSAPHLYRRREQRAGGAGDQALRLVIRFPFLQRDRRDGT